MPFGNPDHRQKRLYVVQQYDSLGLPRQKHVHIYICLLYTSKDRKQGNAAEGNPRFPGTALHTDQSTAVYSCQGLSLIHIFCKTEDKAAAGCDADGSFGADAPWQSQTQGYR